jgi:hypothetical protein
MLATRKQRVSDFNPLVRGIDAVRAQHVGQIVPCVLKTPHDLILIQTLDCV